MAECVKTGESLPERNVYFVGFECRERDRCVCPNYSYSFLDGTNCRLLRRPVDVSGILGLGRKAENV